MTKNNFLATIIFAVVLLLLFFSCKEDSTIGLEFIPEGDRIDVQVDTTRFIVRTLKNDSVVISNVSKFLLGSYTDPDFGQTGASFAAQFLPLSRNGFSIFQVNLHTV